MIGLSVEIIRFWPGVNNIIESCSQIGFIGSLDISGIINGNIFSLLIFLAELLPELRSATEVTPLGSSQERMIGQSTETHAAAHKTVYCRG